MNATDKILNSVCIAMLFLDALVVLFFETELIKPGYFVDMSYLLDTICVIETLIFIPVSLKLMFMPQIKAKVMQSPRDYLTMALIRLGLLLIPAHFCLLVYYLTFSSTTLGCAIISTIALLYVWPTQSRRLNETSLPDFGERPGEEVKE